MSVWGRSSIWAHVYIRVRRSHMKHACAASIICPLRVCLCRNVDSVHLSQSTCSYKDKTMCLCQLWESIDQPFVFVWQVWPQIVPPCVRACMRAYLRETLQVHHIPTAWLKSGACAFFNPPHSFCNLPPARGSQRVTTGLCLCHRIKYLQSVWSANWQHRHVLIKRGEITL